MKSLRKKLAGILAFAMVLCLATPASLSVRADGTPTVEIDLSKQEASVSGADGYDVAYTEYTKGEVTASGSALTADGKELVIKDSAWDTAEVDGGTGTVDLSWVSQKKDSYVIFRFTKSDDVTDVTYTVQKAAAQVTNLKVGFAANVSGAAIKGDNDTKITEADLVGSAETGYLYFYTADKTAGNTLVTPSSIEWKKGASGTYQKITSSDDFAKQLTTFKAKGATLYFQIAGDKTTWASKEVKYAYKKQANAPTAKVDVTKHTIALKAGQEYRVYNGTKYTDWFSVDDLHSAKDKNGKVKVGTVCLEDLALEVADGKATKTVGNDEIYGKTNLKVQVRTAANTTKGTIASKTSTVTVKVVSGGAEDVNIGVATTNAIQVAYTTPYDASKGITLTNTSDTAYEFTYLASGDAIGASTKWTKLAATTTKKEGTAKIAAKTYWDTDKHKLIDETAKIVIRMQGNSKTSELSGNVTEFAMSDLQETKQSVQKVEIKSGNATLDNASPAAVSLKLTSPTGNAVTVELTYTFEGLDTTKGATPKVTVGKTAVSKGKVSVGKVAKNGNTAVVTVKLSKDAEGSGTYTIKVQNVECTIDVTVEKAAEATSTSESTAPTASDTSQSS
jgi:hypothetical protein